MCNEPKHCTTPCSTSGDHLEVVDSNTTYTLILTPNQNLNVKMPSYTFGTSKMSP